MVGLYHARGLLNLDYSSLENMRLKSISEGTRVFFLGKLGDPSRRIYWRFGANQVDSLCHVSSIEKPSSRSAAIPKVTLTGNLVMRFSLRKWLKRVFST